MKPSVVGSWVVDSSVAAKWLLPSEGEPLTRQANAVLRQHLDGELRLLAPDLIHAEVGNVLCKAVRQQRITAEHGRLALQHFAGLGIEIIATRELLQPSFLIAVHSACSYYDSLFVALALHRKASLVTADERLVKATAAEFPVRWLGAVGDW